jgi:hypothetical protein
MSGYFKKQNKNLFSQAINKGYITDAINPVIDAAQISFHPPTLTSF